MRRPKARRPERKHRNLAAAGFCLLAFAGVAALDAAKRPAPPVAEQIADPSIVRIAYRVDRGDWGNKRPLLCRIPHRYGLGDAAVAATLYINGQNGACAPADRSVALGETVQLAVWAPAEFDRCLAAARHCR
jgi:hypothetical protein